MHTGLAVPSFKETTEQLADISIPGSQSETAPSDVFERLHREAVIKQLQPAADKAKANNRRSFPQVEPKLGYFEDHTGGHTDLNRSPSK